MKYISIIAVLLAGCAGSKADLNFRKEVQSAKLSVSFTAPMTFTVTDEVVLRNPAASTP